MLQQVAGHNLLHRELGLHGHLSVSAAALVQPHDQAVLILCLLHHIDLYAVSGNLHDPAMLCESSGHSLCRQVQLVGNLNGAPSVTAPVWGYSA